MQEKIFEELGLTKGESKVYLYLLKAGISTTGPIVKNSAVAYSKVYEILERLLKKGLVSYIIRKKTKYYKALPPSRLKDYINQQKKALEIKDKRLQELLPKLINLTQNNKISAEIYIGAKGLLTAYENLLENAKKEDTLKYFYSYTPETYKKINDFYYQLFPKIKKIGIAFNAICNKNYKKIFLKEIPPKFLKVKFVNFPVPSNIDIFKNKIIITAWKETLVGILIESAEIADSLEKYFDEIWKQPKPF
jgi:sugar-specific transcriptional regulator TrmB